MNRSDASSVVDRGRHVGVGAVEVEVVHDLRALVADVAVVLEARGPAHGREIYRRTLGRRTK